MAYGFSLDPLDAPRRHCFNDSDDEDDVPQSVESPYSLFTVEIANKASVDLLVIGTSPLACKFLQSHVIIQPDPYSTVHKHIRGIGHPCNTDNDPILGFVLRVVLPVSVSKIYKAQDNEGTLICINDELFKEDNANGWSRQILETLRPQTVVVLHSQPLQMYYNEAHLDEEVDSYLKGLVTSCWTLEPLCDFLPKCNVIGGEPAAIMTHCQLHGIPAAMASLYVSSSLTIKEQVNCYIPLLTHPLLSASLSVRDPTEVEKLLSSETPKPRTDVELLYT